MILPGAPNFRDLGGIAVAGGIVRRGLLFRSGAFASLGAEDVATLATYGIRTVVDLRRQKERVREPNRLPEGMPVETVNFDVANAFAGDIEGDYWGAITSCPDGNGAMAAMRRVYAGMPQALHGWLATGFDALARNGAAPAVIHCAVGKDRTGLVIALLLHLLGAGPEAIAADYMASNGRYPENRRDFYRRRILERTGIADSDAICQALTGVNLTYLQAGLDAIVTGWGGLDPYLQSAGVLPDMRERLQALYVEPILST